MPVKSAQTERPAIGLVALSGCLLELENLESVRSYFDTKGWDIVGEKEARVRHQRFAGTDEHRLSSLYRVVSHPRVRVVLAMRGGYGLSRLLDKIDYKKLADSKKLFMGYSDFTALLAAGYTQARIQGIHAPTAVPHFSNPSGSISPQTEAFFWNMINHGVDSIKIKQSSPAGALGQYRGTLWGGNLSMLVHLLGTDYFPRIRGGILYLEDVNEHPYRIERMMLQLHYAGVLSKQSAVLLGGISGYQLNALDNGYDLQGMLTYLRRIITVPIISGLPIGHHQDYMVSLPFGGMACLEVAKQSWQLRYARPGIRLVEKSVGGTKN